MGEVDITKIACNALLIVVALLLPVPVLGCYIIDFSLRILRSFQPKRIAGEIAVVTGGGNGLGRSIALELAKYGCHIAVVDIDLPSAEETVQLIKKTFNVSAKAYQVDISSLPQIEKLNNDIKNDMGLATILVNNAAMVLFKNLVNPEPAEIERLINVNVTSHFWINSVFLENMKTKGRGHIVGICSMGGVFPLMSTPHYSSSKTAVRGLMRALRLGLKTKKLRNIHTTTVFPHFMNTNHKMQEILRNVEADSICRIVTTTEVAQKTVKAILHRKEEVFVPEFFAILHRIYESFPTYLQDLCMRIIMNNYETKIEEFYGTIM